MAEVNPELQERLEELDRELEEGDITQKGYQKRRTQLFSQFLGSPPPQVAALAEPQSGLRIHSPDDSAHPSGDGHRAAAYASLGASSGPIPDTPDSPIYRPHSGYAPSSESPRPPEQAPASLLRPGGPMAAGSTAAHRDSLAMDNIQAKARYYNAQLDKELSKYPQLNQFQAATGVPKTYLALGAGTFMTAMIFFNFAGKLLSNVLGWVYPAYRSFKALESPSKDDDRQWLTYWAVYGFVSILESFTDVLLYWFPFYFFLKSVFLLWLMIPSFNGAATIYVRILRPFLVQHRSEIDSHLDNVKAKVSAVASELDGTAAR